MILVHAMDRLIYEIASTLNGGALRVSDSRPYKPLFLAPGFDANPLVPTSNPKDISRGINEAVEPFRNRPIVGRNRFLTDLEQAGRATPDEVSQWYLREPTGLVTVVLIDSEQVPTRYEPSGNRPSADEFLSVNGSAIETYEVMGRETHSINNGSYVHELEKL